MVLARLISCISWGERPGACRKPVLSLVEGWQHGRESLLLLLTLCLSGCSPLYVLRAGYEEAKILWRRQAIETVLRRDDLDADTRAKLELVLAARAFARDTLRLRVNGSYSSLARVDQDQVVHVVSAAYCDRLEPYTWWFPIVGRVPYKGFFSKEAAEAQAKALEEKGYDTYVRPSVAFSTLGWFADPLLSNLLRYDRVTLADVIIHELLHNTAYIGGHADFDESFATFVGNHGAMAFFATRNDTEAMRQASKVWEDTLQFSEFLGHFTSRLRQAYAAGLGCAGREPVFMAAQEEFRAMKWRTRHYADFATRRLNNSIVLHYLLYADRLWTFETLLQQHGDSLADTIATILRAARSREGDPFAAVEATLESSKSRLQSPESTNAVAR